MKVYLASPGSQLHAHAANNMPVLISYATFDNWLADYLMSFESVLVDSGAYSEYNSGKAIELAAYKDWSAEMKDHPRVAAVAGLDNIRGDWRAGYKNFEAVPWSFPTWHDSDPAELLADLIAMAQERRTWLGIGFIKPREGKENIVRWALERIPESIHVHGWALRRYVNVRQYGRTLDSVDSTNVWLDAFKLKVQPMTRHLTVGECVDIIIKRYQRWQPKFQDERASLFDLLEVTNDSTQQSAESL